MEGLPVVREESQRLSASDFPEEDFWPGTTSGLPVARPELRIATAGSLLNTARLIVTDLASVSGLLLCVQSLRSCGDGLGSVAAAGPCRSHCHSEFALRNGCAAGSAWWGPQQTSAGWRVAGDQIRSGPLDCARGNKTRHPAAFHRSKGRRA